MWSWWMLILWYYICYIMLTTVLRTDVTSAIFTHETHSYTKHCQIYIIFFTFTVLNMHVVLMDEKWCTEKIYRLFVNDGIIIWCLIHSLLIYIHDRVCNLATVTQYHESHERRRSILLNWRHNREHQVMTAHDCQFRRNSKVLQKSTVSSLWQENLNQLNGDQ